MRLSNKGDYGIRALVDLAQHRGRGPIPSGEIAARQGIPESLVGQVLGALRTAGFARSVRGAQGGHELAMDPSEIRMDAVVRSLDGAITVGACLDSPNLDCTRIGRPAAHVGGRPRRHRRRPPRPHPGRPRPSATRSAPAAATPFEPRPLMNNRSGIVDSLLDLVGETPMLRLQRVVPASGAELLGKLESLNPGGSVKDRIAKSMIEAAERDGLLHPGDTLVEPTSGNTGVGLALVAAAKGYHLILTMPEDYSVERRKLFARYGAELVLTPAIEGMSGAVFAAEELAREPGHFMPQQFQNPANPDVHRRTTAEEIWTATGGRIDAFVAGVGTGGHESPASARS